MQPSRRTFLGRIAGTALPAIIPGSISSNNMQKYASETHHGKPTVSWVNVAGADSHGASPGRASGRIQYITIHDDSRGYPSRDAISGLAAITPGDVVVTPDLYPNMIEEIRSVAGLVVYEERSLAGRGSVVAREFGIPAVINCPQAKILPAGALARVNGDQGTIHIPIRHTEDNLHENK